MSTDTLSRNDTDALEDLDFENICRCRELRTFECGSPATWMVIKTCCSAITFNCDTHIQSRLGWRNCRDCGGSYDRDSAEKHRIK